MNIILADWGDAGLDVLRRGNTAAQKQHIGGPEIDEQVLRRHQRYILAEPGVTEMFLILADGQPAGAIGYWERTPSTKRAGKSCQSFRAGDLPVQRRACCSNNCGTTGGMHIFMPTRHPTMRRPMPSAAVPALNFLVSGRSNIRPVP